MIINLKCYMVDCLKSEYKSHSIIGKEHDVDEEKYKYPNCTMPWQQSMLDQHWSSEYKQEHVITCNDTMASSLFTLDYEYLKQAARLNITGCQGR